jgi:hypothetical protein
LSSLTFQDERVLSELKNLRKPKILDDDTIYNQFIKGKNYVIGTSISSAILLTIIVLTVCCCCCNCPCIICQNCKHNFCASCFLPPNGNDIIESKNARNERGQAFL